MSSRGRPRNRGRVRGSESNAFVRGVRMRNQEEPEYHATQEPFAASYSACVAPNSPMMMYYQSMMSGCIMSPQTNPELSPPYEPSEHSSTGFSFSAPSGQQNDAGNSLEARQDIASLRTGRVSVQELMGGLNFGSAISAPPNGNLLQQMIQPNYSQTAPAVPNSGPETSRQVANNNCFTDYHKHQQQQQRSVKVADLFRCTPSQYQNNVRMIRPSIRGASAPRGWRGANMGQFQPPAGITPRANGVRTLHQLVQSPQDQGRRGGRRQIYTAYLDIQAVQEGLKRGELVEGKLRVNQRNFEEAYIEDPNSDLDILIYGMVDRNRSFHSDTVVVQVKPRNLWRVNDVMYRLLEDEKKANLKSAQYLDEDGPSMDATSTDTSFQTASEGLDSAQSSEMASDSSDESAVVIVDRNSPDISQTAPKTIIAESQIKSTRSYTREEMVNLGRKILNGPTETLDQQGMQDLAIKLKQMGLQAVPGQKFLHLVNLGPDTCTPTANSSVGNAASAEKSTKTPFPNLGQAQSHGGNGGRNGIKLVEDFPEDAQIPEECLTKTGMVVYISEKRNSRAAVGNLKTMSDNNRNWALFVPNDSRIPRMMIPGDQVPKGFFERPQDFLKFIYIARVEDWQPNSQMPKGGLCKSVGEAGEMEPETEGMLTMYDICTEDFSDTALECLPKLNEQNKWTIPQEECDKRRDFRDECILTIDPTTARDLDDALHIKKTGDGFYEVGVHIADVSHFLASDTVLDDEALKRATSVYLVHKVIPMLPRLLCEDLCSLNPGVDRLSFSVVWKMDTEGKVVDVWFGRSVIRSRCKLTYDIAQGFLDQPERVWKLSELPPISDDVDPAELSTAVNTLDGLAKKLRRKRYDNGALRLDQPKLSFALDSESGLPNGCSVYQIKDSNKLIEEFMLLANMSVARKIYDHFPEISVLRRHPPPNKKVLREVLILCQKLGYPIDGWSAGDINRSLRKHWGGSEKARGILAVLSQLCMKPMKLAVYFCSGMIKDESQFHHYALNVPFYTHFTSPIRRYPDVMVHRLLGAALGYNEMPTDMKRKEVEMTCQHCNDKKATAKTVSDLSSELFFCIFVKACGPIEERGIVMNVMDHSLDILLVRYGMVKRVYCDKLNLASFTFEEGPPPILTLRWKEKEGEKKGNIQSLTICDMVDLELTGMPEPNKYMATIKPPEMN